MGATFVWKHSAPPFGAEGGRSIGMLLLLLERRATVTPFKFTETPSARLVFMQSKYLANYLYNVAIQLRSVVNKYLGN